MPVRDGRFPEYLACFDWRDWRPPAESDDPAPWYSCWYLGLCDWISARRVWASERGVDERRLPREMRPPTPDLLTAPKPEPAQASNTAPVRVKRGQGPQPRVNRASTEHQAHPIKLH